MEMDVNAEGDGERLFIQGHCHLVEGANNNDYTVLHSKIHRYEG